MEGNPAGHTVVTREAEWTDHELAKMEALAEYEAGLCACGFHQSQTVPGVHHYKITERVCPVCASTEKYARVQHDRDQKYVEALGEKPKPTEDRLSDGRHTYVQQSAPPSVAQ